MSKLDAKVKAVNRANEYSVILYRDLANIFRPLIGHPVLKADGELLHVVKKLLPDFPFSDYLHIYRHSSDYSLAWVVKTCENIVGECSCVYHESVVCVGYLDGNILTEIGGPPKLRSDYSVEAIQEARKQYRDAKKRADELKSALVSFGEYE